MVTTRVRKREKVVRLLQYNVISRCNAVYKDTAIYAVPLAGICYFYSKTINDYS